MRPRPAFLLSASRPPPSKPRPRPAYSPPSPLPSTPPQRDSHPRLRPRSAATVTGATNVASDAAAASSKPAGPSPLPHCPPPPRTSASTTAPGDAAGRITNNGQEATNAHPDGRGRARARTKAMGSVDHIFCFPLDNAPWSHLPCCARTGGDSGVPRFTAPSVVP